MPKTGKLTQSERAAAWRILDAVLEKISYDTEITDGKYIDSGDIVICLEKAQYLAAKRAYNKLLLSDN